MGRALITIGLLLVAAGVLFLFAERVPFLRHLGRLPGDIEVRGKNSAFYFPLATSLLLSLLLSLGLWLFRRFFP